MTIPRIASAAALYFAAIFALGFVLGSARVLWLAPRVGQVAAVLIELPLMLAASWLAARRLTRRFRVTGARDALAMGALAFALLLAAELALALTLGSSAGAWLAGLGKVPGLIGLAGQAGFALMPVAVRGAPVISILSPELLSPELGRANGRDQLPNRAQ